MFSNFEKISVLFFLTLLIYFLHKYIFRLNRVKFEPHQKYSNNFIGIPIGGFSIFFFSIFYQLFSNYSDLFFLFLIFLLGVLSDYKIFNSPFKRLIVQILIVLAYVASTDLQILSTRIELLDNFLKHNIINIIFTSFCILIVINGSNFIDGLNGLVIGYYSIIIFVLLNSDLNLILDKSIFINLLFVLSILIIFNFLNKVFLGDNGSYLLGFIFSVYLIKIFYLNPYISPYFIILLLWYPCIENLFSIIRKKINNFDATNPDNNHLHQLIFFYLSKKLKINSKIINNNFTSLIINIYQLPIFFVALKFIDKTSIQITLITINIFLYILLYSILLKFKKI